MSRCHLVILKKPYVDAILAGKKTVESRFYRTKRPEYQQIQPGDRLLLKISSGPVCASAVAEKVEKFEGLTPQKLAEIYKQYNHLILGEKPYWRSKINSRFGFLVWLRNVRAIEPRMIHKKDWRAWVVLSEKQNFGLLP